MNVFVGVLIVLLCVLTANLLAQKYRDRQAFFVSLNSFHEKFKREVLYSKKSLIQILNEDNYFDFSNILTLYVKDTKANYQPKYLRKTDLEFIKSYCENVGVGNTQSQLSFLQSVDDQVCGLLSNATEEQKKYCKLYLKLGFLIGLMFMVVIL